MAKGSSAETVKKESQRLRGTIAQTLAGDSDHFEDLDAGLLKFHGTYQQDNRDTRDDRRREGLDKEFIFMCRSKIPGGDLTAEQYLVHDRVADELANGTLRITSRQGFQLHGIVKDGMKPFMQRVNDCGITTWGACGDVVRNVMATPVPLADAAHRDVQALCVELKDVFAASTRAYSEIWLDGEKLPDSGQEEEPVYGEAYLPRKFKIGIAIPPRNDIDVYTQDLGLVAHVEDDRVAGYTVLAGGGFGMTHGKVKTYPRLGTPVFYVAREHVVEACKAIVSVQRDFGGREDRKHARMKYLLDDRGVEWFVNEVTGRMRAPVQPPRAAEWDTVADPLGWHEQGDGKLFLGLFIQEGRIKDEGDARFKSGLRVVCERFGFRVRLTANCNIIFYDIDPAQRDEVNATLAEYGIALDDGLTNVRKTALACVSLPTCGLALGESERVFPQVLDKIDVVLRELNLAQEPILFRMTGCPNGCARPYNADFAFVGRSPNKYAFFVGGAIDGTRLAGLEQKTILLEEIPDVVRPYLESFAANRKPGETFSAYWGRTRVNGDAPHPEQFHKELAQRSERLAGSKTGACGE